MVKIQGHRGFSELYPENTMIAFQKTFETGASGIEMDVRLTADNEYIIMHDGTVDRTTEGTGTVSSLNYHGYIDTLEAGSWINAQFTGERVPTLDMVLDEFKNKNITLILHLYVGSTASAIHGVIDKVIAKGMLNKVQIFGDIPIINIAKSYNSNLYTLNAGQPSPLDYKTYLDNAVTYGHNAVSLANYGGTDQEFITAIRNIKSAGKDVHISYLSGNYNINIRKFIDFGADYILGNNPKIMQDYVNSIAPIPTQPASYTLKTIPYMNKSYGKLKPALYEKRSYGLIKIKSFRGV